VSSSDPDEILVVDDTPASLKLLAGLLGEAGYRVRLAPDGELALRSARQRPPALVLLDVRMPGMNGYEVCRALKADEKTRSVPVIFLSVSEDDREKSLAFELGGVDYVNKPVRAAEVLARVGVHLTLRRAQLELEAQNAALASARESLEQRVQERSAELERANQKLKEQVQTQLDLHDRLRESEARLSQIIDFLPDATFAIDLGGKVIAWNRAMEQMTGIKAVDDDGKGMLGRGDYEYAVPFYAVRRPILVDLVLESSPELEERYARFKREGGRLIAEGYAGSERLPGVYLTGTAAPLFDSDGKLMGAIESLRDISERKRSEDALRVANERFASVLRAATAYSIIAMGPSGLIEVMNEGAELMLGYPAAEVVERATPMLFHDQNEVAQRAKEQQVEPGFEVLVQKARRGEIDTREWTYVRRDGSRLTVSLTVTAMRSQNGEFTGFICVARDVTGEKQLEQQLLQSQKMECVGQLSGGVAHDFNNLLTPIKGYVELMKMSLSEQDPLRQDLLEIERAADSAKELTQQLLAFSRKQIIDLKPVDLRDVVRRSANILRRTIRENVAIELKLSPSLGVVRADAGQIELVLVNLSINAQDAMPNGGLLSIETADISLDEGQLARHAGLSAGRYVMLAVHDTGTGMDEATMSRIFEPFFTTKDIGKGTGLGLSTAYGVIKQHGGSIQVHSEKGRGSSFKILLPRVNEAEASPRPEPSDLVQRGTETILVVEDNQMVRSLLSKLLPGLGYQIVVAGSADESVALAQARQDAIHLLLTDVVMPGSNGRELYDRLRKLRPELKVLFMSGYTTDIIGHHGVLDPGVHFLHKPFTRSALSAKIRQALES
jgi:two-component system, cell cycle sensor histidine kinase and response regulator CckA